MRFVEKIDYRFGNDSANTLDRRKLRHCILAPRDALKFLDGAERLHQILCGYRADVTDAEPEQETRGVESDAIFDRLKKAEELGIRVIGENDWAEIVANA